MVHSWKRRKLLRTSAPDSTLFLASLCTLYKIRLFSFFYLIFASIAVCHRHWQLQQQTLNVFFASFCISPHHLLFSSATWALMYAGLKSRWKRPLPSPVRNKIKQKILSKEKKQQRLTSNSSPLLFVLSLLLHLKIANFFTQSKTDYRHTSNHQILFPLR